MCNIIKTSLEQIQPYIRYVNNYEPSCSYVQRERVLYDYEFMYVMDGSVEMHYDGAAYELHKSDLFFFQPNVKNFSVIEYEKHFRTHCIHFDWMPPAPEDDFTAEEFYLHSILSPDYCLKAEKLKKRPIYRPIDFQIPTHIKELPYEKFATLFSQCYYSFIQNQPASKLRLKSLFLEIIAELTVLYHPNNNTDTWLPHPKIIYAIEYIKANYNQPLTTPLLAARYGLSPKYFGALFKSVTGMSVNDFILDLRVNAAKEMLMGTSMTIDEIAREIGFNNAFYFSKCFKDKEKLPPSKYRNMITNTGVE